MAWQHNWRVDAAQSTRKRNSISCCCCCHLNPTSQSHLEVAMQDLLAMQIEHSLSDIQQGSEQQILRAPGM
jgi:hypothetical protein